MNKIIAAVFFLFLVPQSGPASEIKVMIGANSSKYLFSSEINSLNRQQKAGLGIGVGWAFDLNQNMKLEVNAFYNEKGAKTSLQYAPSKTVSGIYKNTSIAFPFFFKYRLKETASPYAALGPELVFILSHHLKIPENEEAFNLMVNTRKIVLAFNVLLGYELPLGKWGLFAEIRYNRWLGNFLVDPEARVKSETISFFLGGVYYL